MTSKAPRAWHAWRQLVTRRPAYRLSYCARLGIGRLRRQTPATDGPACLVDDYLSGQKVPAAKVSPIPDGAGPGALDPERTGDRKRRPRLYSRHGKRLLDLTLTLPLMVLLSPVLAVIALLVRLNLGSPVLFRQQRPGLDGKPFSLYKFRTMTDARDARGSPLPDADRLTSPGRFLRGMSLDELPELLNVLKGEMSLVGPRPLLMQYLQRYTPEQMRRHDAKPGITGWAQVNGRNALTWEQKFALDVWYVDNQSFLLDLKIIALTVWKTLRREGINQPGQATAEEFKGTINQGVPSWSGDGIGRIPGR